MGAHKFSIKGTEYELFFAEDGQVEVCESKNPGKTGFFFSDVKSFTLFINDITDLASEEMERKNKEG
ncbi:MAG TPA: hypothetical protein VMZ91_06215 [Candidatus Paceibacterota bacterium]|nr:hypothetical protein [Candidatus Paceibacterota bacterium]